MMTRDEELAVGVLIMGMCESNDEAEGNLRRVRKALRDDLIPNAPNKYHRDVRVRALEVCDQTLRDLVFLDNFLETTNG